MPIISKEESTKKERLKIEISDKTLREINDYMKYFGIKNIDHFIEESCEFILKSDKDWRKVKKDSLNTETI